MSSSFAAANATDAELAGALLLQGAATTDAARLVQVWLIDELAARHGDLGAELAAWAVSLTDERSQLEVVASWLAGRIEVVS